MNTSCNCCEEVQRLERTIASQERQLLALEQAATKFYERMCAYRQALYSARSMMMNPELDIRYPVGVIDDALEG